MGGRQHFILTRFNVDIGPHRRAWDDAWLAARFELFSSICLPSVRAQTCQDFTWLVFFAATSQRVVESFLDGLAPMPNLHPIFTADVFGEVTAADAVLRRHDGVSTSIMTTRLDNDDALAADVVERLQSVEHSGRTEFLNFPVGYQLAAGRFFVTYDPANAFCTMLEPWSTRPGGIRTVFCAQHQLIGSVGPVHQLGRRASWLQVVHDDNLMNRANGLRIGRRRAAERFSHLPHVARLPQHEDPWELMGGMVRSGARGVTKVATSATARRRLRPSSLAEREGLADAVGS